MIFKQLCESFRVLLVFFLSVDLGFLYSVINANEACFARVHEKFTQRQCQRAALPQHLLQPFRRFPGQLPGPWQLLLTSCIG